MIKSEREIVILRMLEERGSVSIRALTEHMPEVSAITVRRDLARLEAAGKLRRTHGGAVTVDRPAGLVSATETARPDIELADALVLPPIGGRWAHTLREHARRRGIPFFAESSPQEGGIYLGPDNREVARQLGQHAARELAAAGRSSVELLVISLEALPNTRDRARGFVEGLRETFPGTVRSHLIDGRGAYPTAYRSVLDALQAFPGIDVLFGVNDHSILAGIEACRRTGRDDDAFIAYSVGAEGGTLLDVLAQGRPLAACAALFPEVVGRMAIDAACHCFSGGRIYGPVETRAEILTPATLGEYYLREADQWRLRRERLAAMLEARPWRHDAAARGKLVSFILHYPAHEWYRNLSAAMAERATELGLRFSARNAEDKYAQEIGLVRRRLAVAAAALIGDGETLLLDGGEAARLLAAELGGRRSLTIVTNSLAILNQLGGEGPRIVLTGGEFAPDCAALIGPAVTPILDMLRVDKAVLSVDGLSAGFGLSCDDGRAAEVARRFVGAARETVVLADHSRVGREARVRICALDRVHTVVTDAGTLPAHRFEIAAAGPRVLLADDDIPRPHRAVA